MDLIEMAAELQHLLMVHDRTIKHIVNLDSKVCDMNHRSLKLVDSDKTGQALQMMMRKTIVEGMREMYKQYRQNKWQEIQRLSKQIMSQLSPDSSQVPENLFTDDEINSEVDERVQHVLKVAMVQQCEFSRNA